VGFILSPLCGWDFVAGCNEVQLGLAFTTPPNFHTAGCSSDTADSRPAGLGPVDVQPSQTGSQAWFENTSSGVFLFGFTCFRIARSLRGQRTHRQPQSGARIKPMA
jgi:hypothetical protein